MRAVIFALLVFWPVCLQADLIKDLNSALNWQTPIAQDAFSLPGFSPLETLIDQPSQPPASIERLLVNSEERPAPPRSSLLPFWFFLFMGLTFLAAMQPPLGERLTRPLRTTRFLGSNRASRHQAAERSAQRAARL